LEEKHSLARDALQAQIENLKAEKASLVQEHHRLELSLAKATTLSDTLSTQLKEQKAELDKCVIPFPFLAQRH
jgi:regulator of replication initiation timing